METVVMKWKDWIITTYNTGLLHVDGIVETQVDTVTTRITKPLALLAIR